jgi:hypothetical protein
MRERALVDLTELSGAANIDRRFARPPMGRCEAR